MTRFGRRYFLAGAGAAAASLGLGSIGSASPGRARRFVFIPTGNGYDAWITMSEMTKSYIREQGGTDPSPNRWWGAPDSAGRRGRYSESNTEVYSLEGALAGAPGLRGFESAGLLDRCMMVYGLSSAVSGAFHGNQHGLLSSTRTVSRLPGGQTIDSYLEQLDCVRGVGESTTPIGAVRIGAATNGFGSGISYDLCASGRGVPLPVVTSPHAAWNAYIRPFVDGGGLSEIELRSRLLDLAARDATASVAESRNPIARNQLERLRDAANTQEMNLDLMRSLVGERFGTLNDRMPSMPPASLGVQEYKRFQSDVALGALISGLTNVVVLSMGAAGGWGFRYELGPISSADSTHGTFYHPFSGLSDDSDEADDQIQRRAELRMAWTLELDSVASLAAGLAATPEPNGDGSMLDNTVLVFQPDNGTDHHGNVDDFPTLLVGGENLGLRTEGRALFYPDFRGGHENRRELYNLLATLGTTLAGEDSEEGSATTLGASIGDANQRLAPGILPELLA